MSKPKFKMSIAEVEVAIGQAYKKNEPYAVIWFDPKHFSKLADWGIKAWPANDSDRTDEYHAVYMNERDKLYNLDMRRKQLEQQRKHMDKERM